jgi:hypothetical protein
VGQDGRGQPKWPTHPIGNEPLQAGRKRPARNLPVHLHTAVLAQALAQAEGVQLDIRVPRDYRPVSITIATQRDGDDIGEMVEAQNATRSQEDEEKLTDETASSK